MVVPRSPDERPHRLPLKRAREMDDKCCRFPHLSAPDVVVAPRIRRRTHRVAGAREFHRRRRRRRSCLRPASAVCGHVVASRSGCSRRRHRTPTPPRAEDASSVCSRHRQQTLPRRPQQGSRRRASSSRRKRRRRRRRRASAFGRTYLCEMPHVSRPGITRCLSERPSG